MGNYLDSYRSAIGSFNGIMINSGHKKQHKNKLVDEWVIKSILKYESTLFWMDFWILFSAVIWGDL